jgi:N-acetylmuramoyl-L-alanine amidase
MEPAGKPKELKTKKSSQRFTSTFGLVAIVGAVALVLATLFTAWTPGNSPGDQVFQLGFTPGPTTGSPGTAVSFDRATQVVGIVAGHWKNDSGAVCPDGLEESQVNLQIASLVQKLLVEQGYTVDLLAEFDPRLEGYQATALVSIHADSCDFINELATGFKVAETMINKRPDKSARLTSCLADRYARITGLGMHSASITLDMTSYHAFGEIHEVTPAAIIETGFLNLDRQFLTEEPQLAAQGIAAGITCFLNNESITFSTPSALPVTPTATP